jgi:hypothetical protein
MRGRYDTHLMNSCDLEGDGWVCVRGCVVYAVQILEGCPAFVMDLVEVVHTQTALVEVVEGHGECVLVQAEVQRNAVPPS